LPFMPRVQHAISYAKDQGQIQVISSSLELSQIHLLPALAVSPDPEH